MLELTFPPSASRLPVSRATRSAFALTIPELVKFVLEWLPSTGLVAHAAAVCTLWYQVAYDILERCHDLDGALSRFVDDVPELRRLMCEMDGVIGGAFAVDFFQPFSGNCAASAPQVHVLELYWEWAFKEHITRAILAEGYVETFSDHKVAEGVPLSAYRTVRSFRRSDVRIDVILTSHVAVFCALMSDCVARMNFITWDTAYCMFPRDVLLLQRAAVWNRRPEDLRASLLDLQSLALNEHGWTRSSVQPKSQRRWIGDRSCWSVELDTDEVDSDDPSPYVWGVNHFVVDYEACPTSPGSGNERVWRPVRNCMPLHSRCLLNTYAVADDFARMFFERLSRQGDEDVLGVDDVLEVVKRERMLLDR